MTTTAQNLRQILDLWPALTDTLGTPTQHSWPPVTLRGYLAALEQYDADELESRRHQAAALRALERSPEQIGERPLLISARVYETMRTVELALHECATQIAAAVQRPPISPAPRTWPTADRARRDALARADAADPRRWRHTGPRPSATWTVLWLLARTEGRPGPFRTLTAAEEQHVHRVAAEAVRRIEAVLDLADGRRELAQPCACGGTIEIRGGAGAQPVARCQSCGALWTERGIVASRDAVHAA
jgi:hypothetical protein